MVDSRTWFAERCLSYRYEEKETDILGPKYWFLTFDNSLVSASNEAMRSNIADFPLSVTGDVWHNTISPFIGIKQKQEETTDVSLAFSNFLKIS